MAIGFPITTLTPGAAQQNLQSDGLQALGLATVLLGPRWADSTPTSGDYDANALTLNISGALRAPFRGIREFTYSPAKATLAGALNESATTLTVTSGQGSAFPAPVAPGSLVLTLSNASGSKREVVNCTARSGDTFTVERGWDGTAAQSFNSGDNVELRLGASNRTGDFYGPDGSPLTGAATVLRLHPQAVLRLERLATVRYAQPGNPAIRPVPTAMVVRNAAGFRTPQWYEADEAMLDPNGVALSGVISFHDGRGLIVDPIYVAALMTDLLNAFAGLQVPNPSGPASGAGGVQPIAALASGDLIHFIDPHGGVYQPALAGAVMVRKNSGGTLTGPVPASGLVMLSPGERIDADAGDNGRLRWGWATNGTLARTQLVPPALPSTGTPAPSLPRQFFRVCVIDTPWYLLGNRTNATVLGIGPDDGAIPPSLLPAVRDQLVIDYLVDGPDVLAEGARILARPNQQMILAVSPTIDGQMDVPQTKGAAAHWPAFPPPNTAIAFTGTPVSPAAGISAAFAGPKDVVVTIAGGIAPDGAHVRIYPQRFVEIPAITEEPSFERADGGAAIASGTNPVSVLLPNPFNLLDGQPKPSPANLTMDIVIAPRVGQRRLTGAVSVSAAAGPVSPPPDPFTNPGVLAVLPDMAKSVCPLPLFGLDRTVTPAPGTPTTPVDLVRKLASEGTPREGPRLPTMARFETLVLTGVTNGAQPPGTLLWDAVVSGGRWARETRSALHASGNPGNPAGPDVHAPGVRVTGALAYDVARHAAKRTQPLIPLPGAPTPGWLVMMGGDNFNPPQDNNVANTGIGVLLETVAAVCETPELSLAGVSVPADTVTLQQIANDVASALGISPPTVTSPNGDRLVNEVRREFFVSKKGLRDALWALRRAVRQARELVYVESPQFARTARPAGSPQAWEIDLVAELAASLTAHPSLRVIICTPRLADFAPIYKGWSRQHYQARLQAVSDLLAVAPDRVAVFHPVGFPGRTAFVRTTSVIVDDVWCLVGTSHWRRRGMTFDGAADIVSFDRQFENGYSKKVRDYRRALMAAKLAVPAPAAGATPPTEWLRLGRPASAFALISETLAQGGLGKIQPLWPGPTDTSVLAATDAIADPDGANGATFITTLAGLLSETGD